MYNKSDYMKKKGKNIIGIASTETVPFTKHKVNMFWYKINIYCFLNRICYLAFETCPIVVFLIQPC